MGEQHKVGNFEARVERDGEALIVHLLSDMTVSLISAANGMVTCDIIIFIYLLLIKVWSIFNIYIILE